MNVHRTKYDHVRWSNWLFSIAIVLSLILGLATPPNALAAPAPAHNNAAPAGVKNTNPESLTNFTHVTVLGTSEPWDPSINPSFSYSPSGQTSPTIVTSINGTSIAAGLTIQITYVSGLIAVCPGCDVDATGNGLPSAPEEPGSYTNPVGNNSGLLGTFTNSSGVIVGSPFYVGNGPKTVVVPTNATQLQLGVNDYIFSDNSGAWTISVAVPSDANVGCVPQPANLVGWWRAEGDASDFIGSNLGVMQNGATFDAGKVGQAFSFNGATQWVQVPDDTSIALRNNLTVLAWFKMNSLAPGSFAKVFSKRPGTSFGPFEISLHNDGTSITAQSMLSTDGSNWTSGVLSQPLSLGTWYQGAFVVDGSNLHTFYLDGQLQGTEQLAEPLMDSTGAALIFGIENGGSFPLDGEVDEVMIFNRALSAAEIARLYSAGTAGVCPGPNHAPVATDDSYSTDVNTVLNVTAPGVLANDTDADTNPLTAVKVSDPAHGAVTLNDDGSFTYTPALDYVGNDSFTYQTTDGAADSNIATVNITVQPTINASGLLGYWKFDDGSGTTAADSSGSIPAHNGTLSGGAAFTASAAPITLYANPGAISLSGSTGLVSVPNSAINRLTNNFTVMGWINPNTVSGYQRIIATARTQSTNGWGFGIWSSSLLFTTNGKKDYISPSAGLKAGQWYHIAAVMDSSNAVTFYLNGVLVGTVTGTLPATADTDDILQLGASTNVGSTTLVDQFNGLIDDVQVYDHALTASEIADLVGVDHCSEFVLRARVAAGEASASKTITLENGCTYPLTYAADTWNGGSGIWLNSATTIEGNGATIERSAAAPQFRILTAYWQPITIRNLTLRGGNTSGSGAGLYAQKDAILENVRFENNTADEPAAGYATHGGALYAGANLTVDRSAFIGNKVDGKGGAIYFVGTTGNITNSVFADDISGSAGAGIYASKTTGNLTLLNNTFTDQYKNPYSAVLVNGLATVKNNIFYNFTTGLDASGTPAVVTEDYNLFATVDNQTQALSSAVINSGGHDRIALSPRFVDPAAQNYHLQANSPAIDLGTDAGVINDADGNARPYGPATDIGAYEYQGAGIPSISITKYGPPYAAAIGQTEFVLTVINEGTTSLDDLRITEQLPAGATYVIGSASNGGTFNIGTLTWDLAPLAPNQRVRVWYQVTATQDLVSNNYSVSSISNPAITASGPTLTTLYTTSFAAMGFSPFPDGYGFANWGTPTLDTDITVADMINIYGLSVCKTQNPCVLTAAAEAERQVLAAKSSGGHCGGMAMSSLWMYDHDVNPSIYQPGAINIFDLTRENIRNLVVYYHSTQASTDANTTGLPAYDAAVGASAVVDKLLQNFADPYATDRYTLWFFFTNADGTSGGHAVVPYAVKTIDNDHYEIYIYDVNAPNDYGRYFEVTKSTGAWLYTKASINPSVPASPWSGNGSEPSKFKLKSLRYAEAFPKVCTTACAPDVFNKVGPANGAALPTTTSAILTWEASLGATEYQYCYDTSNDNACSSWYIAGTSTSKSVSGLSPKTTYYWHVRAKNASGYTYTNGSSTAFWSFTTAQTLSPSALTSQSLLSTPAANAGVQAYSAQIPPSNTYEFQLEGEGYLMITRSDGKRAGIDPATGEFIAEIPGAEELQSPDGLLNVPNPIRVPHVAGMTYSLRVSDQPNEYGNASATADVNILGDGYITRLKGLKIDSPADPAVVTPGSNDVMNIVFNGDDHSLSFTSSTLDSDTPSLAMAISRSNAPDFTFEIGGAQMPSGHTLNVAIDPATGWLTVTNDDPASNSYNVSVERINLDGSKTSYTGTINEEPSGLSIDLGPSWNGGQPPINQLMNHAPTTANDSYNTPANTALAVTTGGVLSNDTDADNDTLTAVKVTDPAHAASFTFNSDGTFAYTPANGFSGQDSFTYKANDGKVDSDAATVVIEVAPSLSITASGAATVKPGDQYVYTFNYTVNATTTNTVVAFTLPGNTTFVSNTGGYTCTPAAGVVTCNLGTVLANDSFTATVLVDKFKKVNTPLTLEVTAYSLDADSIAAVNGTTAVTANTLTPFSDVPYSYWALDYIQSIWAHNITGGCVASPLSYCPEASVTRAQMAVFLLRAEHGPAYTPPAATGIVFGDVPLSHWAGAWIEQLKVEGITGGCGNGNFCPDQPVTRDQMAVFLLRAEHGSSYVPPAPTGVFTDIPASHWAAAWIEQLYAEGVTAGCGGGNYCPATVVNRAQMAVFLVRIFNLP